MIRDTMMFVNFKDFYENADRIKKQYTCLGTKEKIIYKMYVYSNRLLNNFLVDKVWEYLNEPFGSVYYVPKQVLELYL